MKRTASARVEQQVAPDLLLPMRAGTAAVVTSLSVRFRSIRRARGRAAAQHDAIAEPARLPPGCDR